MKRIEKNNENSQTFSLNISERESKKNEELLRDY
jgi:hypothetical protein